MTFAQGQFNPNPFANPFNTRIGKCSIKTCKNLKDLQVPNQDIPMYGSAEWEQKYGNFQSKLTVPNQDIPLGDQLKGNGFLRNSDRLFRLADGTLVDFKTRKIIYSPNNEKSQYWGNPNAEISMNSSSWNDDAGPKLEDLINRIDDYYGRMPQSSNVDQLDQESIDYWLKAEEEAEALKSSMTDAQKAMIANFEKHFPKSRLIEESKKLVKYKQKR